MPEKRKKLLALLQSLVVRVSFWNLHDGQSWLNYFPRKRVNYPLLFDRQESKPAFEAVMGALGQGRGR